jgi:hypothetical protein
LPVTALLAPSAKAFVGHPGRRCREQAEQGGPEKSQQHEQFKRHNRLLCAFEAIIMQVRDRISHMFLWRLNISGHQDTKSPGQPKLVRL